MPATRTDTHHSTYAQNVATQTTPGARPRRRAFADTPEDVSPAGQGAVRLAEKEDEDPMVMVTITRDFKLTSDDHVVHEYRAGTDEMPLSHAKHWFARNAGGVKLLVGRRATAEQKALAEQVNKDEGTPARPPDADPKALAAVDQTTVPVDFKPDQGIPAKKK